VGSLNEATLSSEGIFLIDGKWEWHTINKVTTHVLDPTVNSILESKRSSNIWYFLHVLMFLATQRRILCFLEANRANWILFTVFTPLHIIKTTILVHNSSTMKLGYFNMIVIHLFNWWLASHIVLLVNYACHICFYQWIKIDGITNKVYPFDTIHNIFCNIGLQRCLWA
jgi:hypothetical protein